MSPLRILTTTEADRILREQITRPCRAHLRFPGDELDAVCGLTLGDHRRTEVHEDTTRTRRWRVVGSDDAEGMMLPGSEPLRRCRYESDTTPGCELLEHEDGQHSALAAWEVAR